MTALRDGPFARQLQARAPSDQILETLEKVEARFVHTTPAAGAVA